MTRRTTIVGKWRLTAMSTWDRDYIDLVEPGFIAFAIRDVGKMAFGVVTATLDCAFDKTRCDVNFDFTGFDEGDEVSGQGWAEMTSPTPSPAKSSSATATTRPSKPAAGERDFFSSLLDVRVRRNRDGNPPRK